MAEAIPYIPAGGGGGGGAWGAFSDLAKNKNFMSMLAGIGTKLDPEGVGGAIGVPAQQMIQSVAAQEATAKRDQEKKKFNEQMMALLGGLSPAEMPGPTSMKVTPDKMTLDVTRPLEEQPAAGGTAPAAAPTVPGEAAGGGGGSKISELFKSLSPFS